MFEAKNTLVVKYTFYVIFQSNFSCLYFWVKFYFYKISIQLLSTLKFKSFAVLVLSIICQNFQISFHNFKKDFYSRILLTGVFCGMWYIDSYINRGVYEIICVRGGVTFSALQRAKQILVPLLGNIVPPLKTPLLKKYWYLFI